MKRVPYGNMDTIPYMLSSRAAAYPSEIAYHYPELGQRYCWSRLWDEVRMLAKGFLQLGIKKGDRVALLMQGRMELILAMYAAACIGAVSVPLNAYSKKEELQTLLKDSGPAAMILGKEGHRQHYPEMMREVILDCRRSGEDSSWLPKHVFVLEDGEQSFFPPFAELYALAADRDDREAFLPACMEISAQDPFILLYTSGTLGTPKGVLRSTASFLVVPGEKSGGRHGSSWVQSATDRLARYFPMLNLLPLYHLGGIVAIFANLKTCNLPILMLSHFHPIQALSVLSQEKCRIVMGTPFMIQQMLASPERGNYRLDSLLGVVFTSAAVTASVLQKVTREMNLLFFMVSYGSSEAGAVANGACFMDGRNNLLTLMLFKLLQRTRFLSGLIPYREFAANAFSLAGKVDRGVEVKIVHPETGEPMAVNEQGEIAIRSHRVMRYVRENKDRACYTPDGWYKSGDLGFLDERRQLTITGRLHRLISRGGEKISPVEIEHALLQHRDVEDALVLGIPDELYGEQVCACIVAKQSARPSPDDLRDHLALQLSAFKLPRYYVFLPSFPLSSTGKVSIAEIKLLALEHIGGMKKHA
ncbi:acyl--CoA ligase [Paenibacillus doosanensis]|uniref:class I adenylate-forming enzyme family protein n=1 Tax=Paenibacillus doosanensis TaxID=1229154 RepID=UPI00217F909C|nr:class I adenylate-forming enzyme family protein [Paenibacillus doosanensis]MCS7464489.1 acyl--CoA ligase [Paenibacillus doosanensis]